MGPIDSTTVMMAIEQIAATPKTNDKLQILQEQLALQGRLLEDVLHRTYSPFLTYGIRKLPKARHDGDAVFDAFTFDLLDGLATRNLTGKAAIQALASEFERLEPMSRDLLGRVILGDLGAGIAVTQINKAKKGLIPTSGYMRCSLLDGRDLADWDWKKGVFSQIKADGMFANINIDESGAWLTSRAGHRLPYEGFAEILDAAEMMFDDGVQIHGELLVVGPDGKVLPRKVGNGMLNSISQGGEWPEDHYPRYQAWDLIPLKCALETTRCDLPYEQRFHALAGEILGARKNYQRVLGLIPYKVVHSLAEAFAHCGEVMRSGLEGTIIKERSMPWRDTGSGSETFQVKLKVEAPCELRMRALVAGKKTGKNASTFGSIECYSECGQVVANIPGFTDKMRKHIFDNWAELQDSIIAVVFNDLVYSETNKCYSLFLPRFDELRPDKDTADDLPRIRKQLADAMHIEAATNLAPTARRVRRTR